jgi:hypothetical protein
MNINNNYLKIVFLLLLVINSCPAYAESQFTVGFDQERIISAKFKSDISPVLYVKKDDTYVSPGKFTKIKIDASQYLQAKGFTYPTSLRIEFYKLGLDGNETWLRTSTKLVTSLPHASKLFLDLDLGSFLSKYNEEFVIRLYDPQGTLIQEYNQIFTAEDFNPDFKLNLDQDFTPCISKENIAECIYSVIGRIMIKQVPSNQTENYFARNNDGSLVMTVPTIKDSNFVRKKKKGNKKKNPGTGKVNNNPVDEGSESKKGIGKFSTLTSDANHYHGYTEHLSKYTFLATSWDPAHPYKNPSLYGNYSAVFGRNNKTSNSSIIAGEDNFTTTYSAVFGRTNTGNSSYSLIAGQDNYVNSSYALVSGKNNEVENAAGSLVVGYKNDVNGEYASAVGHVNKIDGQGSHIWGSGITVNGDNSFAFGFGNTTNPTIITGDKKVAFVYGTETLMIIDGVNGSVSFGGGVNGAGLTGNFSGTFNGSFFGDGSGIRNLDPDSFSGPVAPESGGTGISNNGNFTWGSSDINIINDHNLVIRLQADTDIIFPTSGILSTRNGTEILENKTLNNATLGPNLTFVPGTTATNDFSFQDLVTFNGPVVFNNTVTVSNCSLGDFLLTTSNGTLQCTNFASVVAAASTLNPVGTNGSIQYKFNGVMAGSDALKVTNNGNGLYASILEAPRLIFPGVGFIMGDASFSDDIDFVNSVVLNDSFTIPSCTTPGFILVNDAAAKFSCVDPSTIITSSSGNGTAAGIENAIQFNQNGSFAADVDFRFENGNLVVRNIVGVENISLNTADILGYANFRGVVSFHNELRFIDGNEGNGKILVGDANGSVSWVDPATLFSPMTGNGSGSNGSSLTVAGTNGSIQFNTGGALAADHLRLQYTNLTFKAQAITGITMPIKNAPATVSINWSEGNQQEIRLTQNNTIINISLNPAGPTTVMMQLVHNTNIGVKTITWPANFKFSDGAPPILSTQANAIDFVSCFFNPTNGSGGTYYCQASYNFF